MDDEEDIFFRNAASHTPLNASIAQGGLNASALLNASAMGLNASTIGYSLSPLPLFFSSSQFTIFSLHTSVISTMLMNASAANAASSLNASGTFTLSAFSFYSFLLFFILIKKKNLH